MSPGPSRVVESLYSESLIALMIDDPHTQDEIEELGEGAEREDSHRQERELWRLQNSLYQSELEPASFDRIEADRNLWIEQRELVEEVPVTTSDISHSHVGLLRYHRSYSAPFHVGAPFGIEIEITDLVRPCSPR